MDAAAPVTLQLRLLREAPAEAFHGTDLLVHENGIVVASTGARATVTHLARVLERVDDWLVVPRAPPSPPACTKPPRRWWVWRNAPSVR